MKFEIHPTAAPSELRLFHPLSVDAESETAIESQLPFLKTLTRQFADITGWNANFCESSASFRIRNTEPVKSTTVFGEFAIDDMSETLGLGEWASNRSKCDSLASTINEMIRLIQQDRQLIEAASEWKEPVVELPFSNWCLQGNIGYSRGSSVQWQIDDREHVHFLVARYDGATPAANANASLIGQTLFQTCVDLGLEQNRINRMLNDRFEQTADLDKCARLEYSSLIEFEPITGQYNIINNSGASSVADARTMILIDVEAQTAIRLSRSELSGDLYSGQVLCLTASNSFDIEKLNERLRASQPNCDQAAKQFLNLCSDEPSLTLHRN